MSERRPAESGEAMRVWRLLPERFAAGKSANG